MKLSHATAMTFIGWYLMMPPMAADLRPDCARGASIRTSVLFLSFLAGTSPREFEVLRCNRLQHTVESYAPMNAWPDHPNTWKKLGQFDTLAECDSQYASNQATSVDMNVLRDNATSELIAEGSTAILKGTLERRVGEIQKGLMNQIASERCIASDPNLAR